jgi:nitrate reductase delta subunit
VLAHLLSYPDAELRAHLPELRAALHDERRARRRTPGRAGRADHTLRARAPLDVEADHVELFDRGRGTALHLFEHVHGDSRDRGPAMVDLARPTSRRPVPGAEGELPDHLTVVLEYASTQPPRAGPGLPGRDRAHPAGDLQRAAASARALRQRAGRAARPGRREGAGRASADEPELDESWAEPMAFDGCSTQGQARPGQPQPIQIVRAPVRHTPPNPRGSVT